MRSGTCRGASPDPPASGEPMQPKPVVSDPPGWGNCPVFTRWNPMNLGVSFPVVPRCDIGCKAKYPVPPRRRSPKGQRPPAAVASEDAGRRASQAGQGWQPLQVPRIRFRCTWRILLWQDSRSPCTQKIVFGARGETCSVKFRGRAAPCANVFVIRGESCSGKIRCRGHTSSAFCSTRRSRASLTAW